MPETARNNQPPEPNAHGLLALLELIRRPAYCIAEDGTIVAANSATAGTPAQGMARFMGRHAQRIDPRLAHWPEFYSRLQAEEILTVHPVFDATDPRVSARELEARLVHLDGRPHAVIVVQDAQDPQTLQESLVRRDAILHALSSSASRYLAHDDWDDICNGLLKDLGEATGVSRAYIFRAHFDERDRVLFSQRYEWVAPGIEPQIDNPNLQNVPAEQSGFGRWMNYLGRGQVLAGQVRDFPPSEQELLLSQSIISLVVVPIFTRKKFWGFMGFDECVTRREWGVAETEALRGVAGLFGLATERREASRLALAGRDRMAHEARLIAMGEMASSIAHEINQPLSAISNYCETGLVKLEDEPPDPEILIRAFRGAADQARRAGEIIRRLREFGRKDDSIKRKVDLNALIAETVELVRHDARVKDIRIVNECDEDLPPVFASRVELQQVLFNLLRNGIDAIEESYEPAYRILILNSQLLNRHLLRINVMDTGPGLDPQKASLIFEPFETSKPGGMGLGLSISRAIMEEHGGSLSVDREYASGACFRVDIPCYAVQSSER